MTPDEALAHAAIRDLLVRYNIAGDRLDAHGFAASFTVDGVIESTRPGGALLWRYAGREAIHAWQASWRTPHAAPAANTVRGAGFIRHHLTTMAITVTGGDTAKARTYWTAWSPIGPDHAGVYLDDLRVEDGEWRIAYRRVRRDWRAPDSRLPRPISRPIHHRHDDEAHARLPSGRRAVGMRRRAYRNQRPWPPTSCFPSSASR